MMITLKYLINSESCKNAYSIFAKRTQMSDFHTENKDRINMKPKKQNKAKFNVDDASSVVAVLTKRTQNALVQITISRKNKETESRV